MAYVKVDVSSYDAFRSATLGKGFDVDGAYGYQCWDLAAVFYYSVYGVTGLPSTGGTHYAYGCWAVASARAENTKEGLTQITKLSDVKRGDIIVLNHGRYTGDDAGHIAFADQDYAGSNTLTLLGQNQVNANANTGHITTATAINCSAFLGGWRYDKWEGSTPAPEPTSVATSKKGRGFPWVLYAKKLRESR